ncbi:stabilizer of axonemal microtubules 5 isoform X2 [Larus michahellis]|uniref:stabilizer of axonemal microtubules 5 isoform X2 n=1 Tax=Larus michahellis TaxID=119627 RepID=UPI003D9B88F3
MTAPAIPAPLTGVPFLKASHIQLGAERWAPGSARQPFSHTQFPPFWGVHRPPPAPPPCSGWVLSPRGGGGGGGGTCSETRLAFPERPLQPVVPFVPPESEKHVSRIKFGDPRSSGSLSEQKHAHSAPEKRTHRAYDKERAASQIHHTNLQLGDGRTRFSTSTSVLFPVHDPEPVTIVRPNKYASSIPRGDEDPERNQALARTTTTQLSYAETDRWNLVPKPDLLKHRSKICLGDERSASRFFSTTQQVDYQPPCQSQRVMADSRSHRESHVPFNYHADESSVTATQAMLVPHRQQKRRLSEDKLQQIKSSHLELPWRAQDLYRTEQKDEFTPKSRSPAEIQKANSQVSCVPLGTLKGYCPQRKVLFAP